jgi:ferredoxin-thioredoxin reductase catalytic subunit
MNDSKQASASESPKRPAQPTPEEIETVYQRLFREAEDSGYHLNPDAEFTKDLIDGLLINERRYGYWNCPCRLTSGSREKDLDIICPCDYRDPDIAQYGACFCALYVNEEIFKGKQKARSIPERRPKDRQAMQDNQTEKSASSLPSSSLSGSDFPRFSVPIWRCKACGYLCGRAGPPEHCPICKVPKDRFERFLG